MISLWPRRKKIEPELPKDKLVVLKDGITINEFTMENSKATVGRGSDSDLQLSDPSVSRHHALFTRDRLDLYIEDLGSTNGTQLNGRTIEKHRVRQGDELTIGNFTLRVKAEHESLALDEDEEDDLDKTVVIQPHVVAAARAQSTASTASPRAASTAPPAAALRPKSATLRFFKGPDNGSMKRIDRSLYTVGKPGGNVAVVARRPQGFYLLHIGGDNFPKINNREIDAKGGVALKDGDIIEVGEILAEINFSD